MLELLIARGRRTIGASESLEAWLFERFGAPLTPPPVAPFAYLGDGGAPGSDAWMLAEPVHLAVDRDRLVLVDSSRLALDASEATALVATLNQHFDAEHLVFDAAMPNRWYVRVGDARAIETAPIAAVRGRPIDGMLPGGAEGARWRTRMTEIQMLLHEHPVNAARERC